MDRRGTVGMSAQPYAGLLERLQGLSVDGSSGYGMPIAAEALEAISSLLNALTDIRQEAKQANDFLGEDTDVEAVLGTIEYLASAALNSDASTKTAGGGNA
jgi:hypothetical protein